MEGSLWLLLQTLPLISAAAAVFFILGWRWRGQDSRRAVQSQEKKIDAENIEAQSAREERDAARAMEEKLRQKLTDTQTELQESNDRQTQLQKELLRLSDELKLIRTAAAGPLPQTPDVLPVSAPAPVPVEETAPEHEAKPEKPAAKANSGSASKTKKPRSPKGRSK